MIIQGTNIPLTITFDEDISDIPVLLVTLWKDRKELKRWEKGDMSIEGDTATLPLLESETMAFPPGPSTVEAKGLTENGQTIFWDEYNVHIYPRRDRNIPIASGD